MKNKLLSVIIALISSVSLALASENGRKGVSFAYDVNFEKAMAQVNGAYPLVNREFARRIRAACPEIRFLNREDDMGLEGLRKAKESYQPTLLLEKFVADEVSA